MSNELRKEIEGILRLLDKALGDTDPDIAGYDPEYGITEQEWEEQNMEDSPVFYAHLKLSAVLSEPECKALADDKPAEPVGFTDGCGMFWTQAEEDSPCHYVSYSKKIPLYTATPQTKRQEWISVEDRLPKDYQQILVSRDFNNAPVCSAIYKGGEYSTGPSVMDRYIEPTHWQPLPQSPTGESYG